MTLYPPHPLRQSSGRPIAFDPARHAAFQALMRPRRRCWGSWPAAGGEAARNEKSRDALRKVSAIASACASRNGCDCKHDPNHGRLGESDHVEHPPLHGWAALNVQDMTGNRPPLRVLLLARSATTGAPLREMERWRDEAALLRRALPTGRPLLARGRRAVVARCAECLRRSERYADRHRADDAAGRAELRHLDQANGAALEGR